MTSLKPTVTLPHCESPVQGLLVALLREVEVVVHIVVADGAVHLHQARALEVHDLFHFNSSLALLLGE